MDILRGPCIALAKVAVVPQRAFDPNNKEITECLRSLLDAVNVASQQKALTDDLGDYVYFPLHHLLQKDRLSDRQSEYLLRILTVLFERAWENVTVERSSQLLSVVAYIVSPEPPGQLERFREKSSELHAAAFECISAVLGSSEKNGISPQIIASPSVPHIITILLASLEFDQSLDAHLAALAALEKFWNLFELSQMVLMLPGTASKLVNFASLRYEKAHVKARSAAVRTFTKVVCECLADNLAPTAGRDERWIATAAAQIDRSIQTLYGLLPNAHADLVLATVEMAKQFALKCAELLNMDVIIQILNLGSASKFETVSLPAFAALELMRSRPGLVKALEKHTVEMVDSIPARLNSHDESQTVVTLDAIRRSLVHEKTEPFLESLLTVLDRGLAITKPKRSVLPKNSSISLESLGVEANISTRVEQALVGLLQEVGRTGGKPVLFNMLQKLQSTPNPLSQMQLLWIAANILDGYAGDADTYFDYLDFTFEIVSSAGSIATNLPPGLTGLSVALLGRLARRLGAEFEAQLVDVLFPVVNLLGSESPLVTHHARLALANIAKACSYPTLQVMVLANKDYILDGVSIKLNTMDISPATPAMLSSLINLAGQSIIPYLDDVVASLFVILDNYHGYSVLVTGIFAVFTNIMKILAADVPKMIKQSSSKKLHFGSLQELLDALSRPVAISDLPEQDPVSEEDPDPRIEELDSDAEDIEPPMPETDEWASPVAKSSYMIAKKIMGYADRFLIHKSAALRFNLLKLITSSLPVLATSDKEFLPSVHKLWPALLSRLNDEELFVVEAALECLGAVSFYSGDFISSRFQELWPSLRKKAAPLLGRSWPQFSSQARLLLAVEKCLVSVIESTPVADEVVGSIVSTFKPAFKQDEFPRLLSVLEIVAGDVVYVELA